MSSTEHPSQKIKSNQSLSGPPPDAAAVAAAAAASSEYLEDSGTPTPSEKVSQWHRDIFMVGPGGGKVEGGSGGGGGGGSGGQVVHPRQCICDQCMAEYGTFKFYNQILQASEAVVNQKYMTSQSSMFGINYHSKACSSTVCCGV